MAEKKKNKAVQQERVENKYYVWGLLALFLFTVAVISTCKIEDDDVFWHLATGRFIVENKYVPDKDVFGQTTTGAEWIPFEWGWDVISYTLYQAGGYNALYVARIVIFCMMFYLYFRLMQKFKVNTVIALLLLLMLLLAIMDRLSPRPHMFSYLFFVLIMEILLGLKYLDRQKYLKKLYYIPLIFLIWGNLHLGVIAGGLFLFLFLFCEVIYYFNPKSFYSAQIPPLSKEILIRLIIVSVVSAAALLINPHGISTYIYAYSHTKMKMLEAIQEWLSPFSPLVESTIVITLYKVLLFAGSITLYYAYKKRDLLFAVIYIGFASYSERAIRLGVDYEIVIILFIALSLNLILLGGTTKNKLSDVLRSSPVKIILGLIIALIAIQAWTDNLYVMLKYYRQTGWSISENSEPVKLFEFLKENNITGIPFNNFETGGYQMWMQPGQKVFVDSRNLNDDIFNEYMSIINTAPGFERKIEKTGFDYLVYFDPKLVKDISQLNRNIAGYMLLKSGWKLVYWDDRTLLFMKDTERFREIIGKYEYRIMNPFTAVTNIKQFENNIKQDPDRAREELKRKAAAEPQGYFFGGMNEIVQKTLGK